MHSANRNISESILKDMGVIKTLLWLCKKGCGFNSFLCLYALVRVCNLISTFQTWTPQRLSDSLKKIEIVKFTHLVFIARIRILSQTASYCIGSTLSPPPPAFTMFALLPFGTIPMSLRETLWNVNKETAIMWIIWNLLNLYFYLYNAMRP